MSEIDRIRIGNVEKIIKDTTYESKQPEQGGTDVSLVTTGEKDAWNKKPSDVQADGTSIVDNNGVANIPKAGSETLGLVQGAESNTGVGVDSQGRITVFKASTTACKNGTNYIACLTPSHQHEASFYGLAKVAGADMANSDNALGVYTDNAKLKIQQMFGLWTPKFSVSALCEEETTNFGQSQLQFGDTTLDVWEELIVIIYQTNSENGQNIASNNWGSFILRDAVNNNYIGQAGYLMGTSPVIIRYMRFPDVLFVQTGWVNGINSARPLSAVTRASGYIDTLRWAYFHVENGVVKVGTRVDAYIHRFI